MSKITYNKLVRDLIPDIIRADNKNCSTRILSNEEYLAMLDAKLTEEVNEYQESKSLEELADITEIIRALTVARGSSPDELEAIRQEKAGKRGSFDKRIFLIDVGSKDDDE